MSKLLEIKDLSVTYGGINAVRGISFDVSEGEIVTLIGANGAGKSSTLRSIVGLVKPSGGSVLFQGKELNGLTTENIVKNGITLVPEGRRVFVNLTVYENLKMGAYMRSDSLETDLNWVYELFPRLKLDGSFRLAYNGSLFAREGLGVLLTLNNLVDTSPESGLVFRPLSPRLEMKMYLIWNKYQSFTPIAERFLKQLQTSFSEPAGREAGFRTSPDADLPES